MTCAFATCALLSHRRRLVVLQTTAKNRLQSVLHRLNLKPPKGEVFARKQREHLFDAGRYPVRTLVQVANLGLEDLLMEVDAIAHLEAR